MNLRTFCPIAVDSIVVQLLVSAWGLVQAGLSSQVPLHWNAAGEANGCGPARFAFLWRTDPNKRQMGAEQQA